MEKSSYDIKFNQLCENSSRTIKREINYENLKSQFIFTHDEINASTNTSLNAANTISNRNNSGSNEPGNDNHEIDTNEFDEAYSKNMIYQKLIASNKVKI